jgi:AcrR family transcriptional regulator
LFAEFGFDGVSLRRITQHAGVELALANYHFGLKTDLFFAVAQRRADELNAARAQAIEALGPVATVENLINAFTRPFTEKYARRTRLEELWSVNRTSRLVGPKS